MAAVESPRRVALNAASSACRSSSSSRSFSSGSGKATEVPTMEPL